MILRRRGIKSLRNQRDSMEKTQNHLESSWPPQVMGWKRKRSTVPRAALSPLYRLETQDPNMSGPRARLVRLAGFARDIGRTCPVKTASTVPKTSETARKIDIQWILV
jgi:hypothetical protein